MSYVHPLKATIAYLSSDDCVQFCCLPSWKYSQLFQFSNKMFYLHPRLNLGHIFVRFFKNTFILRVVQVVASLWCTFKIKFLRFLFSPKKKCRRLPLTASVKRHQIFRAGVHTFLADSFYCSNLSL